MLVRFLDRDNQVVRKVSEHYEIRGELAQIERAKQGEVVFYRESELPAGIYSMETVVHDAPSGKSSVRFATVEVPRYVENTLRMSSLVVVLRGENGAGEGPARRQPDAGQRRRALSPNLGDADQQGVEGTAVLLRDLPGEAGAGARRDDRAAAERRKWSTRLPMPVPPADASGRVQQLGRLPIDQLAPGTYELRAIVKQGDQQVTRSSLLRIID